MVVGLLSIELHIPDARSLKEKRMVVKGLKDRLKRMNVAIAETEFHDLWQRAELGIVSIGSDDKIVNQVLSAAAEEIERVEPGLITRTQVEFLT